MSELPDILARIVERRRLRLAEADRAPETGRPDPHRQRPFAAALSAGGRRIIAEVKMGSPRLGSLVGVIDPDSQARVYAQEGAAALSVVVEPDFFHGSYDLLERCRAVSGLPTIAKDFVVDRRQLLWARDAGADAVLLIAALLDRERLTELSAEARELGLEFLIETHDRADLEVLGAEPWPLVGVNNRDLRTFDVDLANSEAMVTELPASAVKVAESGLRSAADLDRLEAAGFDAFLIGESLLTADDPRALLRSLLGC